MLKGLLSLAVLSTLSLTANASFIQINDNIQDYGEYTFDTVTNMQWLDVTETRDLSYNQVQDRMVANGSLEGWRYATVSELDTLFLNFGMTPVRSNCSYGNAFCDFSLGGDNLIIEQIINALGDTFDAMADSRGDSIDAAPNGAGYVVGILGSPSHITGSYYTASVYDGEYVYRDTGAFNRDNSDEIYSVGGTYRPDQHALNVGSFLVRTAGVTEVPEPSGLSLLALGLVGLGFRVSVSKSESNNLVDSSLT